MKPGWRPHPPGRPPRTGPRPPPTPARRPPHKVPTRLVERATAESVPEAAPASEPVRRRSWRWARLAFGAIAVVVLVIECVAITRSLRSSQEPGALPAPLTPLVAPTALPREGTLVESEVRSDGSIAVDQWIRSAADIDEVSLSAPEGAEGSDPVRATKGRLVAADGTVLADDLTIGAAPKRVRFADPTTMVRATYVLRGAVDSSDSVDGRLLARVVALDLDSGALAGPTVVVVAAGGDGLGEVRNLACANARSTVDLLRPCGSPEGSRWRVRLPAERRTDRVTAQVDLP